MVVAPVVMVNKLCKETCILSLRFVCYHTKFKSRTIAFHWNTGNIMLRMTSDLRLSECKPISLGHILGIMFYFPTQSDGPGCRNPDAQRGRLLGRRAPDRSSGTANGNFQERGPRRTAASRNSPYRECAADGVLNLSTSQIPLPRDTVVVLDVRAGEGVLSRALRYECHEIIQSSLST